jgi:hypothetical protein
MKSSSNDGVHLYLAIISHHVTWRETRSDSNSTCQLLLTRMATKNCVFSNTRVVSRQGIFQSPTRKRANQEVRDSEHTSWPRNAFGDLNDAVDSDSSIEIFEGNLFAQKILKGTKNLSEKQPKPYASYGLFYALNSIRRYIESTHSFWGSPDVKSPLLLHCLNRITRQISTRT